MYLILTMNNTDASIKFFTAEFVSIKIKYVFIFYFQPLKRYVSCLRKLKLRILHGFTIKQQQFQYLIDRELPINLLEGL